MAGRQGPQVGRGSDGCEWHGRRRAAPLVIQTYGFDPHRFYLDGANGSDGATSGYAGRAFLRHGVLVLAFPYGPDAGTRPG